MEAFNIEISKAYNEWINSDNVEKYKGRYITQCGQWKNPMNAFQLKKYFLKEYHFKNVAVLANEYAKENVGFMVGHETQIKKLESAYLAGATEIFNIK
jgi:hypothetical protein